MGHLSACGSKIARKIERARRRAARRNAGGAGGEGGEEGEKEKNASGVLWLSALSRGISRVREVAEEFSFEISTVAREEARQSGEKSAPRKNWIFVAISNSRVGNLCFTFNKTKRPRRGGEGDTSRYPAMYCRVFSHGSFLSSL